MSVSVVVVVAVVGVVISDVVLAWIVDVMGPVVEVAVVVAAFVVVVSSDVVSSFVEAVVAVDVETDVVLDKVVVTGVLEDELFSTNSDEEDDEG